MEEIYRILIPTDYSETADYALDMGITFAKRANAEVHLFHNED
ncbi:MAG: nucleotide-binding universal stress UspA family protein, partial [Roseivirga sp.]